MESKSMAGAAAGSLLTVLACPATFCCSAMKACFWAKGTLAATAAKSTAEAVMRAAISGRPGEVRSRVVSSGEVRSGEVRSGEVRPVRLDQETSGQERSDKERSGQEVEVMLSGK